MSNNFIELVLTCGSWQEAQLLDDMVHFCYNAICNRLALAAKPSEVLTFKGLCT